MKNPYLNPFGNRSEAEIMLRKAAVATLRGTHYVDGNIIMRISYLEDAGVKGQPKNKARQIALISLQAVNTGSHPQK